MDPYRIIVRHREWYVVGWDHLRKAVRTFLLPRIEEAGDTEEPFRVKNGFDLDEYLASAVDGHQSTGPVHRVKLRFAKEAAALAEEYVWNATQKVTRDREGRIVVEFETGSLYAVERQVLGFGGSVEVLAPAGLRADVQKKASALFGIHKVAGPELGREEDQVMSIKPDKFVGIDLTDCYAANQRCVDVAVLDNAGNVKLENFTWPARGNGWPAAVVAAVQAFGSGDTIFVIDGPQALSEPQNNVRRVEQHLRTPGRTPWQLPHAGARPFAGYIRTSIEFFNALIAGGFRLAELVDRANLYEAYPGAAWPLWHHGRGALESKSTLRGCQQRREILEAAGCRFTRQGNFSHDELDATLCAALGWRLFYPTNGWTTELAPPLAPPNAANLAAFRGSDGNLREGRMLMPTAASPSKGLPNDSPEPLRAPAPRPLPIGQPPQARPAQLPISDWVYFATGARANRFDTYRLAENEGVIVRTVFGGPNNPIRSVAQLTPGQTILLAYGQDNRYSALCRCRIDAPTRPVEHQGQRFEAVAGASPVLSQQLPTPVIPGLIRCFTNTLLYQ